MSRQWWSHRCALVAGQRSAFLRWEAHLAADTCLFTNYRRWGHNAAIVNTHVSISRFWLRYYRNPCEITYNLLKQIFRKHDIEKFSCLSLGLELALHRHSIHIVASLLIISIRLFSNFFYNNLLKILTVNSEQTRPSWLPLTRSNHSKHTSINWLVIN